MHVSSETIRGISVFETVDGAVVHTAVVHWNRLLAAASDGIGSTKPSDGSGRALGDVYIAMGVH